MTAVSEGDPGGPGGAGAGAGADRGRDLHVHLRVPVDPGAGPGGGGGGGAGLGVLLLHARHDARLPADLPPRSLQAAALHPPAVPPRHVRQPRRGRRDLAARPLP